MYEAEFRRCLIAADVPGIMKVWAHVSPHLVNLGPDEALLALHMARVEAKSIPRKLKLYSLALLAERGIEKIEGKWTQGLPRKAVFAEAVGIASLSAEPGLAKKIVRVMQDALLNGIEKGVVEPLQQRELMLGARHRYKFKHR